jgi:hypothetical protein
MDRSRPNWGLWKHIPELTVMQAVALTLNVEPRLISASRRNASDFSDRLFLFESCFGTRHKISLLELAKWAQSVDWNIPVEIGPLAPLPAVEYQAAPDDEIDLAIASILAPGANAADLRNALESEGWRFIISNGTAAIPIRDGTVKGQLQSFGNIYSAAGDLYHRTRNEQIGRLMRGSCASGGGAMQSSYSNPLATSTHGTTEGRPVQLSQETSAEIDAGDESALMISNETAALLSDVSLKAQLWQLADLVANETRPNGGYVSLNMVCKELCREPRRKANTHILRGQKRWHGASWMKTNGRLAGWKDPQLRK